MESSVGSALEFLVETAAGGEPEGGRRLLGEAGVDAGRRMELGGDAAAGEHGVPGGPGPGRGGLGAVADEMAVAHPGDDATFGFTVLAFGGPAVFLLAGLLFQYATRERALRSRALGSVALAILAIPAAQSTLIGAVAAGMS